MTYKKGDRVYVKTMGNNNIGHIATVIDPKWKDSDLILTVFDEPSIGHDNRFPTKGSWLSSPESVSPATDYDSYEVDED